MMHPLDKTLRNRLERTIKEARDIVENAARAALEQLGVGEASPFNHLSEPERALRRKLRIHGRQLGDLRDAQTEVQEIECLVEESAYQHWHRMLFARFLAENNLLMYPDPVDPVPVTLEECEDLATDEGAANGWELAARYAAHMLPQIFRVNSPVLALSLPPEHQQNLEKRVADLPVEVFTASDSLGWVYQFWQAKRKEEVNASEVKIGARELPAVTQLFTEPYMVAFLLDNSLGAWWAARNLRESDLRSAHSETELRQKASIPGVSLEYLRFLQHEDDAWTLASGAFDRWPECLSELKTLDPCCGSGHFLVATFLMLVPMRMEREGLSAREAVDAVLRENLHGLELDQRCVELAAFALALAAWKYPGAGGYRSLPELNVACTGLAISAKRETWLSLASGNITLRLVLEELYEQFNDGPILGSLINIEDSLGKQALFELKWENVGPLLQKALAREKDDEKTEIGVVARGVLRAASLLRIKYNLIVTNVPYLGRSKQHDILKTFIDKKYPEAVQDIGSAFLLRILELLKNNAVFCVVTPQNWSFLKTYKRLRDKMFARLRPIYVAELGAGAFETPLYDFSFLLSIFAVVLDANIPFYTSVVVSDRKGPHEKALGLQQVKLSKLNFNSVNQMEDKRLLTKNVEMQNPLSEVCDVYCGIQTGDNDRFVRKYWETETNLIGWEYYQRTPDKPTHYAGMEQVLLWQCGKGIMSELPGFRDRFSDNLVTALNKAKAGFVVHRMGKLPCSIAAAKLFDQNGAVLVPKSLEDAPVIWNFIGSSDYHKLVRSYDNKVGVTPSTLIRPSFKKIEWRDGINELPKPYTNDPTQWIFHGHPCGSVVWDEESKWTAQGPLRTDATVLHIAVTRLLGCRWPAELDPDMELADQQREWVNKTKSLLSFADEDGIVCIPPVRRETSAADRLLDLLVAAYGDAWTSDTMARLLADADHVGKTLETWLRDKFFTQHCKLFHHRPFIWQIWDGLPDGFSALVNYHKLDYKTLETLTYTYLGNWMLRQKENAKNGIDGATEKIIAAENLKKKLELILEGQAPYDIFVRWKPIEEQPIGWHPDLNDGVRLNIRPFLTMPDVRIKGAGILRDKPNIKWNKDRGKDVPSAPWYHLFYGDRINDHHLTLAEKRAAREAGS